MSWLKAGDRFVGEDAGKPVSGRVIEAGIPKCSGKDGQLLMWYRLEFTRFFRSDDARLTDRLHGFEEDRQAVSNRQFVIARLASDGMLENNALYPEWPTLRFRKSESDQEATLA